MIYHHTRSHSHLLAVRPRLCLGGSVGAAAVESEGPGALFRDIPGTGVSVESAGSWDTEGRMAATGRMGSEGGRDFAPPTTHLCFAHHLLPSVWQKSEHRRASRCTHGPLGRFPWSDLRCGRHKGKTMNHRKHLSIFSKIMTFCLRPTERLSFITLLSYRTSEQAGPRHVPHRVNPVPVVGFENTRAQLNKHNQGEDHMTPTDLWAVWACEWKASRGLAHWTIGGRQCVFVYQPSKPQWWWIHYNREALCTLFDLKPAAAWAKRACNRDPGDDRSVVTVNDGMNAGNVDLILLNDEFKGDEIEAACVQGQQEGTWSEDGMLSQWAPVTELHEIGTVLSRTRLVRM